MAFHLPEFIDECVDASDPLAILLMREGAFDEAEQLHASRLAEQRQYIERALIEQRPDQDDEYLVRQQQRTRKSSTH